MKWLPGPEALFVFGMVIAVPVILARFIIGASWVQVGSAFLLWVICLAALFGGHGVSKDEQLGWTIIMTMFFGWLGVPFVALVLRGLNLPYRLLS